MYKVEVDQEKCIGCEECVDVCPSDVFEMQDENPFLSMRRNVSDARVAWRSANRMLLRLQRLRIDIFLIPRAYPTRWQIQGASA